MKGGAEASPRAIGMGILRGAILATFTVASWSIGLLNVLVPYWWRDAVELAEGRLLGRVAHRLYRWVGGDALYDTMVECQAHQMIRTGSAWVEVAPLMVQFRTRLPARRVANSAWSALFCMEQFDGAIEAARAWLRLEEEEYGILVARQPAYRPLGFALDRAREAVRMSERALGPERPRAEEFCRRWRKEKRRSRLSIFKAPERVVFGDTDA